MKTTNQATHPSSLAQRLPLAERLRGVVQGILRGDIPVSKNTWGWVLAVVVGIVAGHMIVGFSNPLLLIGAVIGGLLTIWLVANIELCLVVFLFATYARIPNVLSANYDISGTKQILVAIVVMSVALRILREGFPTGWLKPALYFLGFLAALKLSFLSAVDFKAANYQFSTFYRAAIAGYLVIFLVRKKISLRLIVWSFLAAGIMTGTLSVYQHLTETYENNYWGLANATYEIVGNKKEWRISGMCMDPNYFALLMVVLMPMALDRYWNEPSRILRVLAGWSLIACGMSMVFTFSRGGFLGLTASLGLMLLRRPPKLSTVLASAVVFVIVLQFIPSSYSERLSSITGAFLPFLGGGKEDVASESSLQGRTSEALCAVAMFRDHPIVGVGLGNYKVHYKVYAEEIGLDSRDYRGAHSMYLQIAAEAGIIGLITFFALVVAMFASLRRAHRKLLAHGLKMEADLASAFGFGVIGFLVCSIFLHFAYPAYFWLFAGLMFAIGKFADDLGDPPAESPRLSPSGGTEPQPVAAEAVS